MLMLGNQDNKDDKRRWPLVSMNLDGACSSGELLKVRI